jgi:hypothetical protein
MPLKNQGPGNDLLKFTVAVGILAAVTLALPGWWGLGLAGLMLLGYAVLNPAAYAGLFAWLQSLGNAVN